MSDDTIKRDNKSGTSTAKKWFSRLIKLSFFILAFLAIIATVLINMGGSSPTIKGALEDYISASTGFGAQIGMLNKMTFFPNISVDIQDLRLKRPNAEAMRAWAEAQSKLEEGEVGYPPPPIGFSSPDATIQKVVISMGFMDIGVGGNRKIHNIQIHNATFNAGSVAQKPLQIDTLAIDETPAGEPFLNINGAFGGEVLRATLDLEGVGKGKRRKYRIGDESKFEGNIGKLQASGIMRPRTMGGFHVRDLSIVNNESPVLNADLSFVRNVNKSMTLKGDFDIAEYGSKGSIDWDVDNQSDVTIIGDVSAETLNVKDFDAQSIFSKTWAEWNRIFKNKETATPQILPTDVTVTADLYKNASEEIAQYKGVAIIHDHHITFESPSE